MPFFYRWETCDWMYGFQPKRSVVDNARFHLTVPDRNNPKKVYGYRVPRWVVSIDLKNAFPSVKTKLLREMYRDMFKTEKLIGWRGFAQQQASVVCEQFIKLMLQLTTHKGCLPQGAPTSPYLLNLAMCYTGVVKRIEAVCHERQKRAPFRFSIYADDITVSSWTDRISDRTIRHLVTAIEEGGWFKVNPDKVRRNSCKYKAHIITGVVLTEGRREVKPNHFLIEPKLSLPQKTLNRFRGQIHQMRLALAQPDFPGLGFEGLDQVLGNIAWVNHVYRGYPMPVRIRQEVEAFEQAWDDYQGRRRAKHDQYLRALLLFLQSLAIWREEEEEN